MVVLLDVGWSDVGTLSAVWQVLPQDAQGNAARGDVLLESARNCYVYADYRLVSLLDLQAVLAVKTSDAVLVAHKNHAQDVEKLVDRLKD